MLIFFVIILFLINYFIAAAYLSDDTKNIKKQYFIFMLVPFFAIIKLIIDYVICITEVFIDTAKQVWGKNDKND